MPQVGAGSDRATLLQYRVEALLADVRSLRLALRSCIPHVPEHLRQYPVRVMEETKE